MIGVAFTGGLGSGKTTQARKVAEHYGLLQTSLAAGLKAIAFEYFDIKDKTNPLARPTYQKIGHGGRQIDPLVWIRYTTKKIAAHPMGGVLDDVRYPNEGEFFAKAGFVLFYLKVPAWERIKRVYQRDFGRMPRLSEAPKILRSLLHPSEYLIPAAVRRAKQFGTVIEIDGTKSEDEIWAEVKYNLDHLRWRDN